MPKWQPDDNRHFQQPQSFSQNIFQRLAVLFGLLGFWSSQPLLIPTTTPATRCSRPALSKCVSMRSKRYGGSSRSSKKRIACLNEGSNGVPIIVQSKERLPPINGPEATPRRMISTVLPL